MAESSAGLRIDKWLWHARFFKTRSLAAKIVGSGSVRVNGTHVKKPSAVVRPGDTLTFAQSRVVRVIRVVDLGERRGPAPEAAELFEDLAPPEPKAKRPEQIATEPDAGARPDKRDRRARTALKLGDT